MDGQDVGAVTEAYWAAIGRGDWDTAAGFLHPEFVQEWPQSGERIRGADNCLSIDRNFPGGMPAMTSRRVVTSGDLAVAETDLVYADGSRYHGVSIMEFRDGKIVKETDYFGEPFSPPQWRAQWVERM
jgi:ketosteroid isomerase-like protein